MTKMLRMIDGWRFERPLAVLLALATGFMLAVMPARTIAGLPGADRFAGPMQPVLATVAALCAGLAGLALMRGAGRRVPAAPHDADAPIEAEGMAESPPSPAPRAVEESAAAAEPSVRVRRADRHPDAPPRAPILATRDLGEPFMEVAASESAAAAILDAEYVELPEAGVAAAADSPETAAVTESASPARPERQSIVDMMARLDAGMARRAAAAMPPRDARPALRDALAELNRLAARRG